MFFVCDSNAYNVIISFLYIFVECRMSSVECREEGVVENIRTIALNTSKLLAI